jgi:carboxypeptidase Q
MRRTFRGISPEEHSFMHRSIPAAVTLGALWLFAALPMRLPAQAAQAAQAFPHDDPILRRIWMLGMDSSQAYPLAQTLFDSIGPRLTGSPQAAAAIDWLLARYSAWGISARKQPYGTWRRWRRGPIHVDLVAPQVRTLEAKLVSWSPGTGGKTVEGEVVLPPTDTTAAVRAAWLASIKGRYVLSSYSPRSCRPDNEWEQWATPATLAAIKTAEIEGPKVWVERTRQLSLEQLEAAGVSGIIEVSERLEVNGNVGIQRARKPQGTPRPRTDSVTFDPALASRVPILRLTCEDYGLLTRLAEHRQGPKLRVNAQVEVRDDVPVVNALAELRGTEKPEESVAFNPHLDSWDAGTGALDNGTGTIMVLEAMRILKAAGVQPKRTILAVHWTGEEQMLPSYMHLKEIFTTRNYLQFHQDHGTGRITSIRVDVMALGKYAKQWLAQLPVEIAPELQVASAPEAGPGTINLSNVDWNYNRTYHNKLDTFDKIVFDDLKRNATLVAMLAYLAGKDPRPPARDE